MTVYARSDVMSVTLSKDHGGCGAVHSRPVTHGAPSRVWALDCPGGCEDHLRSDPKWSASPMEVPETPDETRGREEADKRGERTREAQMESAVASLASTTEGMQKLISLMIAAQASTNPQLAAALDALTGEPAAAPDQPAPDQPAASTDLTALPVKDLKTLARQRGLSDAGTRAQLLDRLTAAA